MPQHRHPFRRSFRASLPLVLCLAGAASPPEPAVPGTPAAAAVLDTAIERMGGRALLEGIARARFDMVTQWQVTVLTGSPYADAPSYEVHTELRDYTRDAWRNTRRFPAGAEWMEMVDVVVDSVAIRRRAAAPGAGAGAWAPLNTAYVDERRELFAFAPERLLLAARGAPDLRGLRDTSVAGVSYARVRATVGGYAATLLLRRTDGFLAAVRTELSEPNDYGLAPWGRMEYEMWYSAWRMHPGSLAYPHQWDVRRVGTPYKRITVRAAAFNPAAAPDSFAVSDSLRDAFLATARRPMHDLPLDSARREGGRFAEFRTRGAPAGAVKLGRRWVLLEAGQAPLNARAAAAWLARSDPGGPIAAAVVTRTTPANGGAAWVSQRRLPLYAGPGAAAIAGAVLRGHDAGPGTLRVVRRGEWLRIDADSMWMEPIDLPDAPGSLLVYVPSLQWLYSDALADPLHRREILRRARAKSWMVTRVGSRARFVEALP